MATFWMSNPQNKDPERAFSLQKYLLLHSQQHTLKRRLSASSMSSSVDSTFDARSRASSRSSSSLSLPSSPSCKYTTPTPTDQRPAVTPEEERTEDDLYGVNHQIKTTLTELLNCESVKSSKELRKWVQSRLMDAEMELKKLRRSRSPSLSEASDSGGAHLSSVFEL